MLLTHQKNIHEPHNLKLNHLISNGNYKNSWHKKAQQK